MTEPDPRERFTALYDTYHPRVHAYAVSRAGWQLAEEVTSETLAGLPGIRAVGRTTDPLGRAGVGVALGDGATGAGYAATERRLVVDPSTGRLLAEETVLVRPGKAREFPGRGVPIAAVARPGTVLNYRAVFQATWTDSAP